MNFACKSLLILFLLSYNTSFGQDIRSILPTFEKHIKASMETWGAPAVAVSIVKDGHVIYEKAFGVKEVSKNEPANEHTVFPIASLTKNFMATLLAQLVDEGKIKWDDPVVQYLPDFKLSDSNVTPTFTIRDLVSHRSGLRPFAADTVWYTNGNQKEILDALSKMPFTTPFRGSYAYQNHMFGVAGLVAEKVTGQTIRDLFTKRFFQPLGMKDSSVGLEGAAQSSGFLGKSKEVLGLSPAKNVATPHHIIDGKVTPLPIGGHMYTFPGSTGANTSISDMSKWLLFQLNNCSINGTHLVSEKNCAELRQSNIVAANLKPDDPQFPGSRVHNVHYGMGWFLYEYGIDKKVNIISHMGGFAGVRALIFLIPEQNLGVAVLSNLGAMRVSMLPEALRSLFLDLYLGIPEHDWNQEIYGRMMTIKAKNKQFKARERQQSPRPPKDLSVYEGEFENEIYGKVKLTVRDKKLWLSCRGKDVPLAHWNGDEFTFSGNDLTPVYSSTDEGYIEFGFTKNQSKANVCAINLLFEGKDDLFKKVDG